jgi:Big-like domain-containing protein/immunoglobulin I-set domain protein
MLSNLRKLQLLVAFTTLFSLAGAVGCRGFFKDPQLTSITVGPQNVNLQQGDTLQMTAVGNFDDGSTATLTSGVFWSSSDDTIASITQGGTVTGVRSGTVTISASSGATTGTTTVVVVLNNVTAITISPNNQNVALGGTTTFTCDATVSGGPPVPITSSVTWTVTDSTGAAAANISISNQTDPATVTVNSNAATGTYTVNASYTTNSQTFTDTATLTVQ